MVRICMNEERVGETKQHQQKKIDREFFFFLLIQQFLCSAFFFFKNFSHLGVLLLRTY